MNIDKINTETEIASLFTNVSTVSGPSSQKISDNNREPAQDSTDIDMPNCPPPPKKTSPREFLGPKAICEPFPKVGQTYMLREPRTGCLLGHTKRKFFLISPSHNPLDSPDINWKWDFEDIVGDNTMLRLQSPWLEEDGTRWILLDVRRLSTDGKVVVSVDAEIKRNVVSDKITLKQAYVYEGGKRRLDGPVRLVAELIRGQLALNEGGEAIGWEFVRVTRAGVQGLEQHRFNSF
ncbi:hypothetical protein QBC36DRAFT_112303 [Triangularia setosa]|uniref:Uncharacterized protein n=1 Tax=Triangularia setosa TaxID=2587417 RepID=A0AAN6VY00_9PEZI|nr:hypothetical protein QBC36DRAFT_112303 [Podospora setosa]